MNRNPKVIMKKIILSLLLLSFITSGTIMPKGEIAQVTNFVKNHKCTTAAAASWLAFLSIYIANKIELAYADAEKTKIITELNNALHQDLKGIITLGKTQGFKESLNNLKELLSGPNKRLVLMALAHYATLLASVGMTAGAMIVEIKREKSLLDKHKKNTQLFKKQLSDLTTNVNNTTKTQEKETLINYKTDLQTLKNKIDVAKLHLEKYKKQALGDGYTTKNIQEEIITMQNYKNNIDKLITSINDKLPKHKKKNKK
jgi:hypothetical protein